MLMRCAQAVVSMMEMRGGDSQPDVETGVQHTWLSCATHAPTSALETWVSLTYALIKKPAVIRDQEVNARVCPG